jgi:aspartyl-tRNA(Asn)/glutamyl-tRNA(Gln) amidotransferase subunit A
MILPGINDSLEEIRSALEGGTFTTEDLISAYLDQIEETKSLNAYLEVYTVEALQHAKELDQIFQQARRPMGKLWGAVFSIKDVISHKGHMLTAGSKMLQGYQALYSATAVERILAEDAIIIGRANCDEFAMGSDNERSYYGPVHNAIDEKRISGGSSGGSAVSVQARTCLMSLGSDTGGSVRQPASFCGLIGFKPSYGRISRHGLIAYGSSFDQIGVIGRHLKDIRLTYSIMHGPDDIDGTLVNRSDLASPELQAASRPIKFAYLKETLNHEGLQPEIKKAFENRLQDLKASGHQVVELSFELLDYVIPCYYVLTAAEASSNLSRYDGIRYGYRSREADQLNTMYTKSRTEGFGTEVKRRILLGTFVLSVGYYDAYFAKAQKIRRMIKDQYESWMDLCDALLLPMTPTTAWEIGIDKTPVEIYLADIYSVLSNLVGSPAVSLPLGLDDNGMPFGLQLLTARFSEEKLFSLAEACETAGNHVSR